MNVVRRALPRVCGMLLGLVVLAAAPSSVAVVTGVVVFMLSAPPRPMEWWRHVRTGERVSVAPEYIEPGTCSVVLEAVGEHRFAVLTALRTATGADVAQVREWAHAAPTTVAAGLSRTSATRVVELLEGAGATATVPQAGSATGSM